ncbi:sensor histidine kinase [Actinorugispora endophytica]|uniref:histidine kinase n=1 Tax=Actinorugispora endophytica TaxID=1605990 RepID=A0A4R6V4U8_9ACTN|nr:ATP-binding protein [Actinorugispora endophytica]TDQ53317.1 sensor histidine kinase regulating citrate/malate metabolism [Actinorugispora endophytica]
MRSSRRRWTLAGQFLAFQLGIMLVVLAAVAGLSMNQSITRFTSVEGARLRSVAENVAALPTVRLGLDQELATPLTSTAANTRDITGISAIVIADERGLVFATDDPDDLGETMPLGGSRVLEGRAWTGATEPDPWEPEEHSPALAAHVPVFSDQGELIGVVSAARDFPPWWRHFDLATPYLVIYLGAAGGLGALGSLLLAARIKRQTLGMEPRQIAATVEQREAMLHGVKEGVLGLDLADRITLANAQAVDLLGLPPDCLGRPLAEVVTEPYLYGVLSGGGEGSEQVVLLTDRVITLNRMPMTSRGERIGSVTTLRDRTELLELRRELDVTRHTTEALRAQAHEFSNRMHTVGGLIALEEYDEAVRFITRASRAQEHTAQAVTARVRDMSLAALLIAKSAMAAERGTDFTVDGRGLGELDADLSGDLVTVVGNLVDNALDAMRGQGGGAVRVTVDSDGGDAVVTVADTGPGVAAHLSEAIFAQGFSTKRSGTDDPRGLGLAIIRLICRRRGGSVRVRNDGGAVFTARLPLDERPDRSRQDETTGMTLT